MTKKANYSLESSFQAAGLEAITVEVLETLEAVEWRAIGVEVPAVLLETETEVLVMETEVAGEEGMLEVAVMLVEFS